MRSLQGETGNSDGARTVETMNTEEIAAFLAEWMTTHVEIPANRLRLAPVAQPELDYQRLDA